MLTYTCFKCAKAFSEADKLWDIAVDSGKCPKCYETLRDFPMPLKEIGGKPNKAITSSDFQDNYLAPLNINCPKNTEFDYSWSVLIANWFLIGVVAFVQSIIRLQGLPNTGVQLFGTFLGGLTGIAFLSLIPVAIIYLANSDKLNFRPKKVFSISGWCFVILMFYPVFR